MERDQEGSAQQFSVAKIHPRNPQDLSSPWLLIYPCSSTHHGDNDKEYFNQGSFCQRGIEQFILVEANTLAFNYSIKKKNTVCEAMTRDNISTDLGP